jgi:hypothetical protein
MAGIGGDDLLAEIENSYPRLGVFFRHYVIPAIQKTAENAAVDTQTQIPAPEAPHSISVTTAGEMMQVTVNHQSPITKGVHYIYSVATNPQFIGAQVEVKPATRAPLHFTLPTKNAAGTENHQYYVAVQTQYPGSQPSIPTYHGGNPPTAVTMSGTTTMDITPGTGTGTATNGGQTLVGLGKSQVRI